MPKIPVKELAVSSTGESEIHFYIDVVCRTLKPASYTSVFHFHDKIELDYCEKGSLKITFVSGEIILEEGDFIFINSNTPHSIDPHGGDAAYCSVKLDPSVIALKSSRPLPDPKFLIAKYDDYIIFKVDSPNEYIKHLFERCKENFTKSNIVKRMLLQSAIMAIMAYVLENGTQKPSSANGLYKNAVLINVAGYISKNYASVTLEEAAKKANMSYSYFSRIFKKEFKTSFSKYLTRVKVEKSMELLSNPTLSVTDIALECGFSNLSHYVKCFRIEKGITPNKFRTMVKVNK